MLLAPDPSKPTITIGITYFVGSADEGTGEAGLAHLLEHMMFKGTPRHRGIAQLLEARGGTVDGTTSQDRTNYAETLPATPENLAWAIALEADRMRNATLSAEDLASEHKVVRNELDRGENNTSMLLASRMRAAAFLWHGYGRPIIGTRADLEAATPARLRAYYDRYYQPDNAALVVAGAFDPPTALAIVERELGAIPKPARPHPVRHTVEPPQDGERSVAVRRVGGGHTVGVLYHAAPAASAEFPAMQAIADALVRKPSGRLYRALVESGLATGVSAYPSRFRDPGFLEVQATVRDPKHVDRVEQILVGTIEELATRPPTVAEIDRFRSAALRRHDEQLAAGDTLAYELSEWSAIGDWRLAFAWRARVKTLGVDDVARVARAYLVPSNRTIGRVIPTAKPDRAPLPARPEVDAIVAALEPVPPVEPGEPFAPTLATIDARTQQRELAGGIRAALLPIKTRGATVSLVLALRYGDETSLAGKGAVASVLGRLAMRGTTTRTYQDVLDAAAKLRADIEIEGELDHVTVRIATVRESLVPALALVADLLRHPRFDAAQLAIVRRELLAELERERNEPTHHGVRVVNRLIAPFPRGDARHRPSIDESVAALQAVTLADVKAFHRRFWGAGHGELTVIGDFDDAAVTAAVRERLAGWTSATPYRRIADRVIAVPPGEHQLAVGDKPMGFLAGAYRFEMRDDDADHAALAIASLVLGGSTAGRLNMRLRERDGLAVGAYGGFEVSGQDRVAEFAMSVMVTPENFARARRAIDEELSRFVRDGITAAELETAKQLWTEQLAAELADPATREALIARNLQIGRTANWQRTLRDRVAALTASDVNRAIRARLDPKRIIWLRAGDLAKAR